MLSHHYLLTNITSQPNSSLSLLALIVTFSILAKASLYLHRKSVNKNIHIACKKAKSKQRSHSGGSDLSASSLSVIKLFKGHQLLVLVLTVSAFLCVEARLTNHRGKGLDSSELDRSKEGLGIGLDYSLDGRGEGSGMKVGHCLCCIHRSLLPNLFTHEIISRMCRFCLLFSDHRHH